MRKLHSVAPLLLLLSFSASSHGVFSQSLKLRVIGGRPVVEDVFLNGQGPFRFLLDTGGETNQVEANLARKLGLAASFQVEIDTAAGTSHAQGGRVERVMLGSAEASNQEFLFTTLDGVHALSSDIQGILGQEFLAHFDYTLDLRGHEVRFEGAPASGIHVPVRMSHGRMAVITNEGDLVLDSGSDTLVLFRDAPGKSAGQIRVASGFATSTSFGQAPALQIGGKTYRAANAAFAGGNSSAETAGLLPASTFRTIFISNSEKYIVVDAEKGR